MAYYARKQGEFRDVMSRLEEMARLGAKVHLKYLGCIISPRRFFQVQHNADNSATLRVTDTQNTIGAVQAAVPAPGTQQYRSKVKNYELEWGKFQELKDIVLNVGLFFPDSAVQVPDGPKDRPDCWVPSSESWQHASQGYHPYQRQRQGERHSAAGHQVIFATQLACLMLRSCNI